MHEAMTIICQVEECRTQYEIHGTIENLDFAVCPKCETPRFPGAERAIERKKVCLQCRLPNPINARGLCNSCYQKWRRRNLSQLPVYLCECGVRHIKEVCPHCLRRRLTPEANPLP